MKNLILLSCLCLSIQSGVLAISSPACTGDVTLFSQADASNGKLVSGMLTSTGSDISDLSPLINSDVYDGDLSLTTQEEVNGFHYKEITGSLTISGDDIVNINTLSALNVVGGTLYIEDNPNLASLSPLSSLVSIGGGLMIIRNERIEDLNTLSGLTTVGQVQISDNNGLKSINGFSSLNHVGGGFFSINITQNPVLESINGFSQLTNTRGILISANSSLKTIDGFTQLTSLNGGGLEIQDNASLVSFNGFKRLTEIHPDIFAGVAIRNNAVLGNLDGLSSLRVIEGPGAHLNIDNNQMLANINGLAALTGVIGGGRGGSISVTGNPSLKNLDGFSSLTRFSPGAIGPISISNNATLKSITGISKLKIDGGNLSITVSHNPMLTPCDALYPVFVSLSWETFNSFYQAGKIQVFDNGANCTVEGILANNPQVVASFRLVDNTTGFSMDIFTESAVIDVASMNISSLTLQAITFPKNVGSVEFKLNNQRHTENVFPYEFNLPLLESGRHTVVTKVFSKANKQGNKGIGKTLSITIINSTEVAGFDLVDLTGNVLKPLSEGEVINRDAPNFRPFSITAKMSEGRVHFVKFYMNYRYVRTEYVTPYALNGDTNGQFYAWDAKPGDYTLVAVPYVKHGQKEYPGKRLEIHFSVAQDDCGIENFSLVNTATNQVLDVLGDGDFINLNDPLFNSFTVIANATGMTGSVKFYLNNQYYRTENVAPYTLTGDYQGYTKWTPQPGKYTLRATPFSKANGQGAAGNSLEITFTIVGEGENHTISSEDKSRQTENLSLAEGSIAISLYPVPFNDVLNMEIDNQSTQEISMILRDSQGQPVGSRIFKNKHADSQSLQTTDLPSGIYFLQVQTGREQKVIRVIKD